MFTTLTEDESFSSVLEGHGGALLDFVRAVIKKIVVMSNSEK
jgi:hypothetical protein